LRFKVFGEEYAQVRRVLGNCRVECYCFDGKVRLCHVRGKFKKRVWINKDDFVLIGLRDYQDDKSDVIHKYTTEEARLLRSWGEIPADKANFDDDGAISGGEEQAEVFSEEENGGGEEGAQESGKAAAEAPGGSSSEGSDNELWQPNNNRNLPVGGEEEEEEEESSEDSGEEESSDDEKPVVRSSNTNTNTNTNTNNKQSTQAILNSIRRNNNRKAGRGGGRGQKQDPAPPVVAARPVDDTPKTGGNRGQLQATNYNAVRNPGNARYNPRGGYAKPAPHQQKQQDTRRGIDEEIDFL